MSTTFNPEIAALREKVEEHGKELAEQLKIKPRNLLTQLAEWARLGLLTRTGTGTYTLPEPP